MRRRKMYVCRSLFKGRIFPEMRIDIVNGVGYGFVVIDAQRLAPYIRYGFP